jgi:hypothetical protein
MTAARLGLTLEVRHPAFRELPSWLDEAEALGLDFAELPLAALPVVRGAKVIAARLAELKALCGGRSLASTVHGHLGINLMEEPFRIGLHLDVLKANITVAAELGARHLVIHGGLVPVGQASAWAIWRASTASSSVWKTCSAATASGTPPCPAAWRANWRRSPTRTSPRPSISATAGCTARRRALIFWKKPPRLRRSPGICTCMMADLEIEPRHHDAHAETVAYAKTWLARLKRA